MKLSKTLILTLIFTLTATQMLLAHGGRRLDVVVIDGKLFAQGYNSGSADQGDFVRPYMNSIHNHWASGSTVTSLPGFDVTLGQAFIDGGGVAHPYSYNNQAALLQGFDLSIELTGAGKWTSPSQPFTESVFGINESIGIDYESEANENVSVSIDTTDLASGVPLTFDLVTDWSESTTDLDVDYTLSLNPEPTGSIYFLQWQLSSANPAIESSDSVYTIFAPPMQFHHQSLALEQTLGTTVSSVPEPSALGLLGLGLSILATRRRRS